MKKQKGKRRGIRKPKGYTTHDRNRNIFIATHGSVTGEAVHFYNDCLEFAELIGAEMKCGESENYISLNAYDNPKMTPFGTRAADSDGMPKELGERIVYHLLCALQRKDGQFFKDLAGICERGFVTDRLRQWVLLKPGDFSAKRLCAMAIDQGIVAHIEPRQMSEICAQLGRKLPDTRGKR